MSIPYPKLPKIKFEKVELSQDSQPLNPYHQDISVPVWVSNGHRVTQAAVVQLQESYNKGYKDGYKQGLIDAQKQDNRIDIEGIL